MSKENIKSLIPGPGLDVPDEKVFVLPEKVLQFGTGALLRALPDYFIDKANKQGVFNGRVVIVKSTDGNSSLFDLQDGLYTVCIRGVEKGKTIQENIINASVSRVLAAKTDWRHVLKCAHNPEMKIIISNTTEVGIELIDDDISGEPPVSFPSKLLAFLLERFKAFGGTAESGMVIIPTELITDNGNRLGNIVLELAYNNKLDYKFIEWLENHNTFCNSLVDRIVPGKPNITERKRIEAEVGFTDELIIMSEVFGLWAIEGNDKIKDILSFGNSDNGVIITPDITLFRELKLRLLNGAHTFNCGTAFLSVLNITRDAMLAPVYKAFIKELIFEEIAPAIPFPIDKKVKEDFANHVFERFCNPFIDHQWQSIAVQYTSKMKMRNMPLLQEYFKLRNTVPQCMATGFAAYLLYMKITRRHGNRYFGERDGMEYEIKDDAAVYYYEIWKNHGADKIAQIVMGNKDIWETDLTALPGLLNTVKKQLKEMMRKGVLATVASLEPIKCRS